MTDCGAATVRPVKSPEAEGQLCHRRRPKPGRRQSRNAGHSSSPHKTIPLSRPSIPASATPTVRARICSDNPRPIPPSMLCARPFGRPLAAKAELPGTLDESASHRRVLLDGFYHAAEPPVGGIPLIDMLPPSELLPPGTKLLPCLDEAIGAELRVGSQLRLRLHGAQRRRRTAGRCLRRRAQAALQAPLRDRGQRRAGFPSAAWLPRSSPSSAVPVRRIRRPYVARFPGAPARSAPRRGRAGTGPRRSWDRS